MNNRMQKLNLRKFYFLLSVLFLFCFNPTIAQHIEAKDKVLRHINKMNNLGFPKGGQVYYIQMKTALIPRATSVSSNLTTNNVSVEVKMGESFLFYKSTYLDIYQDKNDLYTVIHPEKRIVHQSLSHSSQSENKQKNQFLQELGGKNLDLYQNSEVLNVARNVKNPEQEIIILKVNEEARKKYSIQRILFYFNITTDALEKQEIFYIPEFRFAKQIVEYESLDLNYSGLKSTQAPFQIFNENGGLKKQFLAYRLENQ